MLNKRHFRSCAALLATALICTAASGQSRIRSYDSKYYQLNTDLTGDALREAKLRVTTMAREYYRRTKSFGGTITKRLPFYLFRKPKDYYAAGGMPGTAGVFNGKRLMAIAGETTSKQTWQVIQHEGFHQFVYAMIGGDMPIWVNEGLAEYFGEAIFTGDSYVVGVVPPGRLSRLQNWIKEGNTISIARMMGMRHALWNAARSLTLYDQAWSMVHFLVHGDGGKYQKALASFLRDVGAGAKWEKSWARRFGSGTRGFEKRWRAYWMNMTPDDTTGRYEDAVAATLTSFLARATSQRQTFATWDLFVEAARAGNLKSDDKDWLPPALLTNALSLANAVGSWKIRKSRGYQLVCKLDSGGQLIGTFKLNGRRVKSGTVKVSRR